MRLGRGMSLPCRGRRGEARYFLGSHSSLSLGLSA
jgi:hypothetical protein